MHHFLFERNVWIGEGEISFSISPEKLHFFTRWTPVDTDDSSLGIQWVQEVEIKGEEDKMINYFTINSLGEESFAIHFENSIIGKAVGKGVLQPERLAWEIKGSDTFQGFEVYNRKDTGDYTHQAEYVSEENFRTFVESRIWKKT